METKNACKNLNSILSYASHFSFHFLPMQQIHGHVLDGCANLYTYYCSTMIELQQREPRFTVYIYQLHVFLCTKDKSITKVIASDEYEFPARVSQVPSQSTLLPQG
ncbi:unnamed protein product [Albugo candida]|uniref:Uncharacterized protein n=1 Tax=Albugo candida TaxID=65357 RepID=A0A024GAU4_9STRA|nr:unnamed protein product [Albugo candida]|eukprot:CCI43799.1 unnamed protein product [Albugo candida]